MSLDEKINSAFDIKHVEPVDRDSKRVGLIGYKVGCTHFWNRWGQLLPCTVV